MIRALIFDFNGVLADDDPVHLRSLRQVAEEEGLTVSDEDYLDHYLPLNDWDCFRALYAKHSAALSEAKLDDLIRRKSVYYFQAIANKSIMFENAVEAVQIAANLHPLAIASGARIGEIRHILAQAGIEQCFCAIVSAEDVRFGKPHPEPFLRAYEKLRERDGSLKPSDCVAIEDSIGGIQSAHQAGMRCLAIAHSYSPDRLKSANPDWIIASIADFASWLEREVPGE